VTPIDACLASSSITGGEHRWRIAAATAAGPDTANRPDTRAALPPAVAESVGWVVLAMPAMSGGVRAAPLGVRPAPLVRVPAELDPRVVQRPL
jgi:hypothetical protein